MKSFIYRGGISLLMYSYHHQSQSYSQEAKRDHFQHHVSSQHSETKKNDKIKINSNFIIVGNGIAGKVAYETLQEHCKSAITVIDRHYMSHTDVNHPQNNREQHYDSINIIKEFNFIDKYVTLQDDTILSYDKILIATGGLPNTINSNHFISTRCKTDYLYNLHLQEDRKQLENIVSNGGHVTILSALDWNAIHLASDLASIATQNGHQRRVTIISPTPGVLTYSFPQYITHYISKYLNSIGVEILPLNQVRYIANSTKIPNSYNIYIGSIFDALNTKSFPTDAVVFSNSTGFAEKSEPARNAKELLTALTKSQCLEFDNDSGGIVANKSLQAYSDVFVAGDIASVSSTCGRGTFPTRDFAESSGNYAALSMLGLAKKPFVYIPVQHLYSNTLGFTAVNIGLCSAAFDNHGFYWRTTDMTQKKPNSNPNASKMFKLLSSPRFIFYVNRQNIIQGLQIFGGNVSTEIASAIGYSIIGFDLKKFETSQIDESNEYDNNDPQISSHSQRCKQLESIAHELIKVLASTSSDFAAFNSGSMIKPLYRLTTASQNTIQYYESGDKYINPVFPKALKERIYLDGPINVSKNDIMHAGYAYGLKHGTNFTKSQSRSENS